MGKGSEHIVWANTALVFPKTIGNYENSMEIRMVTTPIEVSLLYYTESKRHPDLSAVEQEG